MTPKAHSYFNRLNYTLANEDTGLEVAMLQRSPRPAHVFSIAGSGGRVLPLLAAQPKRVTCVDLAQEQLHLTELRFESTRALSHEEFVAFWGYPPSPMSPHERRENFARLRLSPEARIYLQNLFAENAWKPVLYLGGWERTFAGMSRLNRLLTRERGARLFEARTLEEHAEYFEKHFPKRVWSALVTALGSATFFNAVLYKGKFPRHNLPVPPRQFYHDAFAKLFRQGPARQNYFLQLLFFGEILFSEGNPVECDPFVFERAKEALDGCEIVYRQGDAVDIAAHSPVKIDFLSFSDVPSYFTGERERTFLQDVSRGLNPGAQVVVRNYLHVPEQTSTRGFENVTDRYRDLIEREKVQMYVVDVYRWAGPA
jgi:S-adenosylmethionine-diacylglycerol 3-amino-3-carboxypropyl transferase